jgi:D-alanyl-lipoteichoic acid acyltransferase DltB (MBOAT superfamily)
VLFHDFAFWPFLALALGLFYLQPRGVGRHLLVLASFGFYAWGARLPATPEEAAWRCGLLALLAAAIVANWALALRIGAAQGRARRRWLALAVTANLSVLAFFKYFGFLAGSLCGLFGSEPWGWTQAIVLPVAISFYTFHGISYVVDVSRGRMQPVESLVDFALYMSFFPHLVAGPIVRANDFLPQVRGWKAPDAEMLQEGTQLIVLGLIKKCALADQFAIVENRYFDALAAHPGAADAWLGMFCFAMHIYFDFAGYTDIARGVANLFGFRFTINFARPYLATSIREFWHRWHVSLSTFLRDYLFIPLGGSRGSEWLTLRNLMLTMLLGGLWHGASWNFLIWGGYHGALLCAQRLLERAFAGTPVARVAGSRALAPLRMALTFVLVLVGWVFFRAKRLDDALAVLRGMITWDGPATLPARGLLVAAGITFVLALAEERWGWFGRLIKAPGIVRAIALALGLLVLELFSADDVKFAFVYFQF